MTSEQPHKCSVVLQLKVHSKKLKKKFKLPSHVKKKESAFDEHLEQVDNVDELRDRLFSIAFGQRLSTLADTLIMTILPGGPFGVPVK